VTDAVDVPGLLAIVDEWVAAGGQLYVTLDPTECRWLLRLRSGETAGCPVDRADRLLIALGLHDRLGELLPPVNPGRRSGLWSKPHPLRKLDERQIAAAHRLHIEGGLSLRELGRQLWERLGYSSPHSCAQALSDAFRRAGLPRRDRVAATIAASTTHGRGARANKAAYKRWHRATFGPWPSDHRRHA